MRAITPEGWADPTPAVAAVTLDNTAPITTLACPVGPQSPNVNVYGTVADLVRAPTPSGAPAPPPIAPVGVCARPTLPPPPL